MKSGNLNFLEPSGPLQACNGTDLPFTLYLCAFRTTGDSRFVVTGAKLRPCLQFIELHLLQVFLIPLQNLSTFLLQN